MNSWQSDKEQTHYSVKPALAASAEIVRELTIPEDYAGMRLDQALARCCRIGPGAVCRNGFWKNG